MAVRRTTVYRVVTDASHKAKVHILPERTIGRVGRFCAGTAARLPYRSGGKPIMEATPGSLSVLYFYVSEEAW